MRALAAFTSVFLLACGPKVDEPGGSSPTGPPVPDDGGDLPACERCVFGYDEADTEESACACPTYACFELLECTNACWSADDECLAQCCAEATREAQAFHDEVRECQQSVCEGACPDGVGRRCP